MGEQRLRFRYIRFVGKGEACKWDRSGLRLLRRGFRKELLRWGGEGDLGST